LKDRIISTKTIPQTIDDLPINKEKELKIDFHGMIRKSLYDKFEEASKTTGYTRNEILDFALESFLSKKK
jgi:hypothetical protein